MSTRRAPDNPTGPAGGGDLAAAVVALTREVEQQRAGIAELTKKSGRAEETAMAAARAVTTVSDAVQGLYAQLDQGDDDSGGPTPPWWMVDDMETARALLIDLTEWVADVYVRYLPTEAVPGCWPFHGDAVTELLALRDGWQAAYYGKRASPAAVLDWHDRWRPGTVKRVDVILRGCGLAQHQAGKGWEQPDQPGGEVVDDVAQWWGSSQGATAPPRPTQDAVAAEKGRRDARAKARY